MNVLSNTTFGISRLSRLLLATLMGVVACSCLNASPKKETGRLLFNDGWLFLQDEAEDAWKADFNDSPWEPVNLPHNAHAEPLLVNDQWQGVCWYRKSFRVPEAQVGKRIIIEFEGAMNQSEVWINGQLVKKKQGGFLPVVFDATPFVDSHEDNIIAVRLDNNDNPVTGPKPLEILDFCTYGGLYRDAWISYKNEVHISHPLLADQVAGGGVFIQTPEVSKQLSKVSTKVHLAGVENCRETISIHQQILDQNGGSIANAMGEVSDGQTVIETEFELLNAELWSPTSPHLYILKTQVKAGGEVVDEQENRFGLREITFRDGQLYVNGEPTFLRGVNRHQEYPYVGYALSNLAQYRDAKWIKDAGFNFIRLSHYPQDPAFMDACDELGILVFDAILGWQYYSEDERFREYCFQSATDLVRRDRNHPCVLAWEVSLNETAMPVEFMQQLHDIVHAEYPSERVYSCGWLKDVYDIYLQARQHRIMHPESPRDSQQPYIVSEYGDWEYYSNNPGLNQHELNLTERYEKSSRQLREYGEERLLQQVFNVKEAHNDNLRTIATGDAYWVMYDYNRGYHDEIESSGLSDIFRIPKFSYYFYQSQINPELRPMIKLATYWNEDSPLNLQVFSNCEEVALFLNGELFETQTRGSQQGAELDENEDQLAYPPFTFQMKHFEAGTLEAKGYIAGECVVTDRVKTPGDPVKLKVWVDDAGVPSTEGSADLVFVRVAAVDADGVIDPAYDKSMAVKVKGDIVLENVGEIKAEAGIATLVILIGGRSGEFNIAVTDGTLTGKLQ